MEAANGRYTVVAPALVHPYWWCGDQASGCPAGTWYDLSQFADRANMHNYPGGAAPKAGTEYGGVSLQCRLRAPVCAAGAGMVYGVMA